MQYNVLRQKWFLTLKILIMFLVFIALTLELLPEVEAKPLVVSTLIIVLIIGTIEIWRRSDGRT
jgi:hypothetical protein